MITTMTEQHPIIPPQELAAQWVAEVYGGPNIPLQHSTLRLVKRASQWGADQELEACCEWADETGWQGAGDGLRTARRPKPPSLAQRALHILGTRGNLSCAEHDTIRRALEALDD